MKLSKLGGLQNPMINNPGTPLPKKRGNSAATCSQWLVTGKHGTGFVLGFLSQKEQFGSISADFNQPG